LTNKDDDDDMHIMVPVLAVAWFLSYSHTLVLH